MDDLTQLLGEFFLGLIKFCGNIIVGIAMALLAAYIEEDVWQWFVLREFPNWPVITYWQFFALGVFLSVFKINTDRFRLSDFLDAEADRIPKLDKSGTVIVKAKYVLMLLISWGLFWIVQAIIY